MTQSVITALLSALVIELLQCAWMCEAVTEPANTTALLSHLALSPDKRG